VYCQRRLRHSCTQVSFILVMTCIAVYTTYTACTKHIGSTCNVRYIVTVWFSKLRATTTSVDATNMTASGATLLNAHAAAGLCCIVEYTYCVLHAHYSVAACSTATVYSS
jgi:hypothetical protein